MRVKKLKMGYEIMSRKGLKKNDQLRGKYDRLLKSFFFKMEEVEAIWIVFELLLIYCNVYAFVDLIPKHSKESILGLKKIAR